MSTDRVLPGVPAGGQFAPHEHDEPQVQLEWTPGTIHPTGGYDTITRDEAMGSTYHLLDGQLHRLDGPAVILGDGTEEWYYEGALHRDGDEPACIYSTGEREWRRYGVLHRDGDHPAKTSPDGSVEFYSNGRLHRGGGKPAVARADGHTEWRVDGQLHRTVEYGPALIKADGTEMYFEEGKHVHPGSESLG